MDIKDLYFGCMNYDFNKQKMVQFSLFQSTRVLRSIAMYRTQELIYIEDPLRFCFGDLWGHVEYEMSVGGAFAEEHEKLSLWDMYVVPNEKLLMDMVNSVTAESCERWLEENKC